MKNYLLLWSAIGMFTLSATSQTNVELFADLTPNGWSAPSNYTEYNNAMVFVKNGNDLEPWISDGTPWGTHLLKDINPNGSSAPREFTVSNGKLFFAADDGVNGHELWISDGTSSGTHMVKNINQVAQQSAGINNLIDYNGKVYFEANDGQTGQQLWVSDGTYTGTHIVKHIQSSETDGNASPGQFTIFNSKLYFTCSSGSTIWRKLWVTDGTAAGTQLVKDINPTEEPLAYFFTVYNGKLYFVANGGPEGHELWVSDGTTSGTMLFKDLNTIASSSPGGFKVFNGKMYFNARTETMGFELWVTDGTLLGTYMLKDINPTGSSKPINFTEYNGRLYFTAEDNFENGIGNRELWSTDGTASGTFIVKDIDPIAGSYPYNLKVFKNKLYFTANTTFANKELYETDGTEVGTVVVGHPNSTQLNPCNYTYQLFRFQNSLFFTADYLDTGAEIYRIGDPILGLQGHELNSFQVFPNPTRDKLTITTEVESQFTLYDLTGKVLKKVDVNHSKEISIADLDPGVYILKAIDSGSRRKIIKE